MRTVQTAPALWQPLRDELARWRDAGLTVRLWLRDDDAVEPTGKLDTLLDVTRAHDVPLLLAVIPATATAQLARRISAENDAGRTPVRVAVHGWLHVNHAPPGEKSQEFGPHRPQAMMHAELVRGRARLDALFGAHLVPVFVPPWNRLDPALLAQLPGAGFGALSAFGHRLLPGAPAELAQINTHLDLIDWHGTRGCVAHDALVGQLVASLAMARQQGGRAVGVMTHHLVHDAAATRFLHQLFDETARCDKARWCAAETLLP